jgi:outer membrane immunogenic protein
MKREFIRCLAGTAAGVLLAGTSAIAADLTPVPPPPPVFTWTGFELGAQVGGGAGRTSVNQATFGGFQISDNYGDGGVFGGIHVGFNYQLMGPIVVGVQGEYNFAGITGHTSAPPLNYLTTSIRRLRLWRHPQRSTIGAFYSCSRLCRQPLWLRCRRRSRI